MAPMTGGRGSPRVYLEAEEKIVADGAKSRQAQNDNVLKGALDAARLRRLSFGGGFVASKSVLPALDSTKSSQIARTPGALAAGKPNFRHDDDKVSKASRSILITHGNVDRKGVTSVPEKIV